MMRSSLAALAVRVIAACILLTMTTRDIYAQGGSCRALDPPGAVYTEAQGINNAGVVVGWYDDGQGHRHGFTFAAGQFTIIDVPNQPATTRALGINDAGQVVGVFFPLPVCNCTSEKEVSGFLYSGGQFTTFDVGVNQTWPRGINNAGQIVGYYHDRNGDVQDAERGFLMFQGSVTRIDVPGGGPLSQYGTILTAINNAGVVLGNASGPTLPDDYPFTWVNGKLTKVKSPPGALPAGTVAKGLNNAGKIVGYYGSGGNSQSSFVTSGKRFSDFNCPGVDFTLLNAANDKGGMAGTTFVGITGRGFYTPPITFIDPVPDLVPEQVLTTDAEVLGTRGREVQGAAADGASTLVVRIPASQVNDQVTVTLLTSSNPGDVATSEVTDGGLGTPANTCCVFTVSAVAQQTSNGPMAFVTYRAPDDFPRPDGGDAGVTFRDVYLRVQSPGGGDTTMPLRLLRPPVVLIHGLWDDRGAWDTFLGLPALQNTLKLFKVVRIGFDDSLVGLLSGSDPAYPGIPLTTARGNALGFAYNAQRVIVRMQTAVQDFKSGANPEKISVAAIQADIVAHSMGGDIVRSMPLIDDYLQRKTLGHGIIHKLITIDTPHTGTPVAARLVSTGSNDNNSCVREQLAMKGYFSFRTVGVGTQAGVPGAVGDLATGSIALQNFATPGRKKVFTAMFAGVLDNFSSLDKYLGPAQQLRVRCRWNGDPLAKALTKDTWPLVFTDDGSHQNDGIVSHSSQGSGIGNVATTTNILHSSGMLKLGFSPFAVLALDSPTIAATVFSVMNQPRNNSAYYTELTP